MRGFRQMQQKRPHGFCPWVSSWLQAPAQVKMRVEGKCSATLPLAVQYRSDLHGLRYVCKCVCARVHVCMCMHVCACVCVAREGSQRLLHSQANVLPPSCTSQVAWILGVSVQGWLAFALPGTTSDQRDRGAWELCLGSVRTHDTVLL